MIEIARWREVGGSLYCGDCASKIERKSADLEREAADPVHRARAARASGARLFQASLPLSQTSGHTVALVGAYVATTTTEHGSVLDAIEAEGWRLEHSGYVYRVTGSVSRDKLLSSGQQEAVNGEIVGVYIFRGI